MSEKTKDKVTSRNINNGEIKTQEDFEEAKIKLEYYKKELEWIRTRDASTAIREINEEARKIRAMINGQKSSEQLYYLTYYNELTVKKYLIEKDPFEYAGVIDGKIKNLVERMEQFKIDSQEFTVVDVIKSMVGKDNRTKEARRMNRLLAANRRDGLPKDVNLSLQSSEQIIAHLKKYGDFVGIILPEPEVQPTELAISEGYLTRAQREYYNYINQTILGKNVEMTASEGTNEKETEIDSGALKQNDISVSKETELNVNTSVGSAAVEHKSNGSNHPKRIDGKNQPERKGEINQ